MSQRQKIGIVAAVLVLVGLVAGIGWIVWWVSDNVGAPGPPSTGNGTCGSADSVNIQLVFADGHTVQACTRDRPACPNETITGSGNGQTSSMSQFRLSNQLRSSSRRYILFLSFDAALPAEAGEQTVPINPPGYLPGPQGPGGPSIDGMLSAAFVQITPRDPYEDFYTLASGSVTVSSSHGVARGRFGANVSTGGTTRPDRPATTSKIVSPSRITGTFACNR